MDYLERRNLLAGLKSFKALGLLSSQWNEIIFTLSRINTTLERTEDELNLINPEPNSFLFMEEDHLVPTIAWPFIISGSQHEKISLLYYRGSFYFFLRGGVFLRCKFLQLQNI